jgi:hypothetical protein
MKEAFIIMQIGNPELDLVCEMAIVPALEACGFDPKRVDKHTEGRLLKSEIVDFIISSEIIVADLTNERPNCYLEVGYAMGLDKFRNLILTSREDHNQDSPNYQKDGPKIHFDLSGYDILFWDPKNIEEFKESLIRKIRRRLATIPSSESPWDNDWINKHQSIAKDGLKRNKLSGFMEFQMTLVGYKPNISPEDLLRVANQAQIHTFGWPIGIMDITSREHRPRPTAEGIVLEVAYNQTYDYWTIKKDGSYYLLENLFEEKWGTNYVYFNTRIVRVTECLLYAVRLYTGYKVPSDTKIIIGIRHGGLKDRILTASETRSLTIFDKYICEENEVYEEVETRIDEIEDDLVRLVKRFVEPLFIIFDYFKVEDRIIEEIVNNFVEGKVT